MHFKQYSLVEFDSHIFKISNQYQIFIRQFDWFSLIETPVISMTETETPPGLHLIILYLLNSIFLLTAENKKPYQRQLETDFFM